MSFDGSNFLSVDQDAFGENEPLDSYGEFSLVSNQAWLDRHPVSVSWTPRSWDADNVGGFTGIRPYASAGWSTILYVPWVVEPGFVGLDVRLYARAADANGDVSTSCGVTFQVELDQVIPRNSSSAFFIPSSFSTSYPWEVRNYSLNSPQKIYGSAVAPLALWLRSDRNPDLQLSFEAMSNVDITQANGLLEIISGNDLIEDLLATRPGATDQHVQYLRVPFTSIPFDFLWTNTQNPSFALANLFANGYDGQANSTKTFDSFTTHPLGYLQIRSIQISSRYDAIDYKPSRYLPQEDVESVDTQRHHQNLEEIYQRKRCVFVGPIGSQGDTEAGDATGYGLRFERVLGNAEYQSWLRAPLELRSDNPRIEIYLHVISTWRGSGWEEVDGGTGEIPWELEAQVYEVGSGSAEVTKSETYNITTFPTLRRGDEPFLTQEDRLFLGGPGPAMPHKEGQLFERDIRLVRLLALSFDLSHDFAASVYPLALRVRAHTSAATFPPLAPIAGSGVPGSSDFQLVCVGWSVWEVPRG